MKKSVLITALILALVFCLSLFAACGEQPSEEEPAGTPSTTDKENTPPADPESEQNTIATKGLTFTLNEAEDGYIVSGMGDVSATAVVIPARHEDLPVVGIAAHAFSSDASNAAKKLTSVTIPEGVTFIEAFAFSGCEELTTIKVPASLTRIEANAIHNCDELVYQISDMISYLGNDENKHVVLMHANVKTQESYTVHVDTRLIAPDAFKNCAKMTELSLPDGIAYIGESAFEDCSKLTSVDLPANLTYIGERAFFECKLLEEIRLPETTREVAAYAFSGCAAATKLTLNAGLKTIGNYAFSACTRITEAVLPTSLVTLGDGALSGTGISALALPAGIEKIGDSTFEGCFNLTAFTIPASVKTIGKKAFYSSGLESIDIPATVTTIEEYAFAGCLDLTDVTLRRGLKTIGDYAFQHVPIENLVLPDGIETIGKKAFASIDELVSVSIPAGEISWGADVFYDIYELETLILQEGVTALPDDIFSYITIAEVVIPTTFDTSSWNASHQNIRSVTLPESTTTITGTSLPAGVVTLRIPAATTAIEPALFDTCTSITTIEIDPANKTFVLTEGCLINKTTATLVRAAKTFKIPTDGSVTRIGAKAFKNLKPTEFHLHYITLPACITHVEEEAFYDYDLYELTFSSGITFGKHVFNNITDIDFIFKGTASSLTYDVDFHATWYVSGNSTIQCTDQKVSASEA